MFLTVQKVGSSTKPLNAVDDVTEKKHPYYLLYKGSIHDVLYYINETILIVINVLQQVIVILCNIYLVEITLWAFYFIH